MPPNNAINTDSNKRRSSVAPLFAASYEESSKKGSGFGYLLQNIRSANVH